MLSKFSYKVSKTFDAPLDYVFRWCTDFTEDDPKMIAASFTRHILEKTQERAVWIQHYKRDGAEKEGVRIVTFAPPDSWYLDGIHEERKITGEYHLKVVGRGRTRLDLVITTAYKGVRPDSKTVLQQNLSKDWDIYKAALERDYALSQK